jgi:hypothetical protein
MSDRIRLNVGGARFETTLTTLCRFPESMLATMFLGSDRINVPLDPDGFAFIDRSYECFAAVLDYYRTGELDWPTDISRQRALARELDFYALEPPPPPPPPPPPDDSSQYRMDDIRRMLSVSTKLELSRTDFSRFDFSHLGLKGSRFKHAVLAKANFRGADLREASLCHADLRGADLRGANLYGANLSNADLRGVRFDTHTLMHNCRLDGANLSGLDLRAFKYFLSCTIDGANFSNADMRGVQIEHKILLPVTPESFTTFHLARSTSQIL